MSKQDLIAFSSAGLLTWLAASAFYAAFGEGLLQIAFWFFALNAFMATGAAALVFVIVARLRRIPRRERLMPALAFALPGAAAALAVMTLGRPLLEQAQVAGLGRYTIFLLACYGAAFAHAVETRFERAKP